MNLSARIFCCLLLLSVNFISYSQGKRPVPGQDPAFPLYTYVDTTGLKKFKGILSMFSYDPERLPAYREFLEQYLNKDDAYAEYLYAHTYDLYEYGHGNPEDAEKALEYYEKSADRNYAKAEDFLCHAYQYSFMNIPADMKKSLEYLRRTLLHGDSSLKNRACRNFASLYNQGSEDGSVKADPDKAISYLELALLYNPKDTWSTDFLAGMYEEKGKYEEAFRLRLASDNEQSRLTAARWLIEGTKVKKDVARGVKIIREEAEKIYPDYNDYMGLVNPVHLLNGLYLCDKLITKEQVGKFFMEYYRCGGG